MLLSQRDKKLLRARWGEDLIVRHNTDFIRSVPKRPVWSMDQLKKEFPSIEVEGELFVDLRGFTFYELRNVHWDHVDMRGALYRKGIIGPKLIGTGSIGNIASSFRRCLFSYIDAAEANIEGAFEECDFAGAKMRMMDFFVDARLHGCNFSGANLDHCKAITNVRFSKCNFTGAMMRRCRLEGTVFEDCVFDGAVLDGSGIIKVRFVRCSMKNVSLQGLISEKNSFVDTDVDPF
jgi:uncharacterized protein YjbI with pentapeptide repeats